MVIRIQKRISVDAVKVVLFCYWKQRRFRYCFVDECQRYRFVWI